MRAPLVIAVLILALAATASAQTVRAPIAPAAPVAPATPVVRAAPLAGSGLQSQMRPSTSLRGLSTGSFSGLSAVGDQAPMCRSQCSRDRTSCAVDDDQCADRWRQCIETCSRPPYR
jgi:hypothetical protein